LHPKVKALISEHKHPIVQRLGSNGDRMAEVTEEKRMANTPAQPGTSLAGAASSSAGGVASPSPSSARKRPASTEAGTSLANAASSSAGGVTSPSPSSARKQPASTEAGTTPADGGGKRPSSPAPESTALWRQWLRRQLQDKDLPWGGCARIEDIARLISELHDFVGLDLGDVVARMEKLRSDDQLEPGMAEQPGAYSRRLYDRVMRASDAQLAESLQNLMLQPVGEMAYTCPICTDEIPLVQHWNGDVFDAFSNSGPVCPPNVDTSTSLPWRPLPDADGRPMVIPCDDHVAPWQSHWMCTGCARTILTKRLEETRLANIDLTRQFVNYNRPSGDGADASDAAAGRSNVDGGTITLTSLKCFCASQHVAGENDVCQGDLLWCVPLLLSQEEADEFQDFADLHTSLLEANSRASQRNAGAHAEGSAAWAGYWEEVQKKGNAMLQLLTLECPERDCGLAYADHTACCHVRCPHCAWYHCSVCLCPRASYDHVNGCTALARVLHGDSAVDRDARATDEHAQCFWRTNASPFLNAKIQFFSRFTHSQVNSARDCKSAFAAGNPWPSGLMKDAWRHCMDQALWPTLVTVDDWTGMSRDPELPFGLRDWNAFALMLRPLEIRPELLTALRSFPAPKPAWVQALISDAWRLDTICHFVGMVAAHEETNGRIALERIDMWDRQTWGIAFRNRSLQSLANILKRGNLEQPTPFKLRAMLKDELEGGRALGRTECPSVMNLLVAFRLYNGVQEAYTTLCLHPGMLRFAQ